MNSVLEPEAIVRSYGEVVGRECAEITAMSEQLCSEAEGLEQTLDFIQNEVPAVYGRAADDRGIYLSRPLALPSQKLLYLAYHDLGNVEKITPGHQRFVGETLLTLAGLGPLEPAVAEGKYHASAQVGICEAAEGFFGRVAKQLLGEEGEPADRRLPVQTSINVYHDAGMRPLLLEKSKTEPSALTLEVIEMDGIVIPPFTIMGGAKGMHRRLTGKTALANGTVLQTYEATGQLSLTPRRLSAAAYREELQRAYFGMSYNSDNPDLVQCYVDTAVRCSPVYIKAGAARLMELCGTTEPAQA